MLSNTNHAKTGGDWWVVFGVLRDPISEKCNFYDLFEISLQK
jgi:hypothetical protein